MNFGWINAVNAALVLLLLLISVVGQKRSGLPAIKSRHIVWNVLEQSGRYACMALMVLPLLPRLEFGFASAANMVAWLVLSPLLLLVYAVLWTRRKSKTVLFGLALVPAVLFLCCAVLLRHPALAVFAVLFGVSHFAITAENTLGTR
ncbi:MAG: hypothetical protein IJU56_00420 [Clostridia bacterium]|nr:hypothetical protein [Clostridia bacterium]